MNEDPGRSSGMVLVSVLILLVLFSYTFLSRRGSAQIQLGEDQVWSLEGGLENYVEVNLIEKTAETESEFTLELEMENNLNLDLTFANERGADGETAREAAVDLEILPVAEQIEPELYLESVFLSPDTNEAVLGLEGELAGVDLDLGVEIKGKEKIAYLDFYNWLQSGVSLWGGIELKNGLQFQSAGISFRGVTFPLNGSEWEFSGGVDGSIRDKTFGGDHVLETSFSFSNQDLHTFTYPKAGEGISLYQLFPLDSGKIKVILFNS